MTNYSSLINRPLDISIIIPCYNSGEFLPDAIASVEKYNGNYKYEIIIINDGSTDKHTLDLLETLKEKGYNIIHQINKGPGAARNIGVRDAKCDYILFLDSDNKIQPEYIDVGISNLKKDDKVAVVHGNAIFFGDSSRSTFKAAPFEIENVLAINYIDVCAVVRKSAWESVNGFDEERELIGREDWELWIKFYKKGWRFLYINKDLFFYRIRNGSLMSSAGKVQRNVLYVYKKHSDLLSEQYLNAIFKLQSLKKDLRWSIRYHIKKLFN